VRLEDLLLVLVGAARGLQEKLVLVPALREVRAIQTVEGCARLRFGTKCPTTINVTCVASAHASVVAIAAAAAVRPSRLLSSWCGGAAVAGPCVCCAEHEATHVDLAQHPPQIHDHARAFFRGDRGRRGVS
jgi:hypothetical protein